MKKSSVILLWGAITSILYIVMYELTNNPDQPSKTWAWIGYLIFFGGLLICTFHYRAKANEGYLTFGEGYKAGLLTTLVIAIALTVHYTVYLQMHPDLPAKLLDHIQTEMANRGMPADTIDKAISIDRMMFKPGTMVVIGFLTSVLTGALFSLATAAICVKKKPLFEEVNSNLE